MDMPSTKLVNRIADSDLNTAHLHFSTRRLVLMEKCRFLIRLSTESMVFVERESKSSINVGKLRPSKHPLIRDVLHATYRMAFVREHRRIHFHLIISQIKMPDQGFAATVTETPIDSQDIAISTLTVHIP